MIRRVLGVLLLAWLLGFAYFMLTLAPPAPPGRTDAIVVPTGAAGRIDRGLAMLKAGAARRMLVTGVGDRVRPVDLALRYKVSPNLFACCVDLGDEAVDTRSNAEETAAWLQRYHFHSLRLVTSDWHMRRARLEIEAATGGAFEIVEDGVPSKPGLGMQVREYNKFLLRRIALWAGLGRR